MRYKVHAKDPMFPADSELHKVQFWVFAASKGIAKLKAIEDLSLTNIEFVSVEEDPEEPTNWKQAGVFLLKAVIAIAVISLVASGINYFLENY